MMSQNKPIKLREKYKSIMLELKSELKFLNVMQVPSINKVVINSGVGKAKEDQTILSEMSEIISMITGQKPAVRRAKVAVSNFKIREGMEIGLTSTLRNTRMWDFLDKLINISLPRIKDFKGINPKSFDGKGNYSLGLNDQSIFPEFNSSKNYKLHGLQITIVTNSGSDSNSLKLLTKLGFPFKKIIK